jgi:hypothetical protein
MPHLPGQEILWFTFKLRADSDNVCSRLSKSYSNVSASFGACDCVIFYGKGDFAGVIKILQKER